MPVGLGIVFARQTLPSRNPRMAISDRYDGLELVQPTPTGDLYRASHTVLGRPVLIRTLDQKQFDASEIEEIKTAVTATAQLVHPNILSVIDAEFGDEIYYVTDNVIDSLRDRMSSAPFEFAYVARWGLQLLRGITHAHAHNVIHRGISPWRIHFDQVGTVLIADFGLTTVIKDKKTGMVSVEADAMAYLPMGVLRRPTSYTESADRYGIAALICELMTGVVPEATTIPIRRAKGEVPDYVVESLSKLLTGRATESDMTSASDAFKRWVDTLGPSLQPVRSPSTSSTTSRQAVVRAAKEAEQKASAAKPTAAPKAKTAAKSSSRSSAKSDAQKANTSRTRGAAADGEAPKTKRTTTRKTRRSGSRKAASSRATVRSEPKPDPKPAPEPVEAAPAAEGEGADRVEDKLNKYAELFAD